MKNKMTPGKSSVWRFKKLVKSLGIIILKELLTVIMAGTCYELLLWTRR